jgi:hypothetical protein
VPQFVDLVSQFLTKPLPLLLDMTSIRRQKLEEARVRGVVAMASDLAKVKAVREKKKVAVLLAGSFTNPEARVVEEGPVVVNHNKNIALSRKERLRIQRARGQEWGAQDALAIASRCAARREAGMATAASTMRDLVVEATPLASGPPSCTTFEPTPTSTPRDRMVKAAPLAAGPPSCTMFEPAVASLTMPEMAIIDQDQGSPPEEIFSRPKRSMLTCFCFIWQSDY